MIIDALIMFAIGILDIFITILPKGTTIIPQGIFDSLDYFINIMAGWNWLLPIDTLFSVIIFIVNFEMYYFMAKIILKLLNFLRGTGSGIEI